MDGEMSRAMLWLVVVHLFLCISSHAADITVLHPDSDTLYYPGDVMEVEWSASTLDSSFVQVYLHKGTHRIATVAPKFPAANGSVAWPLNASMVGGDDYWVKVVDSGFNQTFGISANFTIQACPDSYEEHGSYCYKAFTSEQTYEDAQSTCVEDGGSLVSIESSSQNTYVASLISSGSWIGFTSLPTVCSEGYSNLGKHCYRVYHDPTDWHSARDHCQAQGGELASIQSGAINSFLHSMIDAKTWIGFHDLAECPYGYTDYGSTCYKVHNQGKKWHRAKAICHSEGADLLSIESADDNNHFTGHVETSIWIGLNDISDEGDFVWSDGTALNYTAWDADDSDEYAEGEDCAELDNEGVWHDIACFFSREFICQYKKNYDFVWSDWSIASYSNWADAEPNEYGNGEDCTEMYTNGQWNDLSCFWPRDFVCEQDHIRTFQWIDGSTSTFGHWDSGEPDDLDNLCTEISTSGGWKDAECTTEKPFVCRHVRLGTTTNLSSISLEQGYFQYANITDEHCIEDDGTGNDQFVVLAGAEWERTQEWKCAGNNLASISVATWTGTDTVNDRYHCAELCLNTSSCVSFGYPLQTTSCYLKHTHQMSTVLNVSCGVKNTRWDLYTLVSSHCPVYSDLWAHFLRSEYFVFSKYMNWTEAQSFCISEGGYLAQITTQAENDFVYYTLLGSNNTEIVAWFGISDIEEEGTWVYGIDGSSLTFTLWNSDTNEPNNINSNEDCGGLGYYANGYWNDAPCSLEISVLCERESKITVSVSDASSGYFSNDAITVCWNHDEETMVSSYVNIKLIKGSSTAQVLQGMYEVDLGCYSTYLNPSLDAGSNYVVRVVDSVEANVWGASEVITIYPESISVSSPDGSDPYWIGESITVSWTFEKSSLVEAYVDITLIKGSATVQDLAIAYDAEAGSYTGMLSGSLSTGTDYYVMVAKNGDSSISGISDIFTLQGLSCEHFYDGSCYAAFTTELTFSEAQSACTEAGASLVSIHSEDENGFVRGLLATDFWIGLSDVSLEGTFLWDDGSSTSYTRWYTGEPNDYLGAEDCTEFYFSTGYWNDQDCSETLPYICKVTSDLSCSSAYGSSCYYASSSIETYADAMSICEEEGASLVYISNYYENAAVAAMISQSSWIGLRDAAVEGTFIWDKNVMYSESFCDVTDWTEVKGTWTTLSGSDCYYQNTQSDAGTVSWLGDTISPFDWMDYAVAVTMYIDSSTCGSGNAGILVRAQNVSSVNDGGQQYYVGINSYTFMVGKMDDGWTSLQTVTTATTQDQWVTLSVQVSGSSISSQLTLASGSVYSIDITDESFAYGTVGLRQFNCPASYDNLIVYEDSNTYTYWNSGEPNDSDGEDCGSMYTTGYWNDYPCTESLAYVCEWDNAASGIAIYDPDGSVTYGSGDYFDLTWNHYGLSGYYLGFQLYRGSSENSAVYVSTLNSAAYSLYYETSAYLPSTLASGWYMVKGYDYYDSSLYTFSSPFYVYGDTFISVSSPDGSTSYEAGEYLYVYFSYSGLSSDYVLVELYQDNTYIQGYGTTYASYGYMYVTLSSSLAEGTNYWFKVSDYSDSSTYGVSATFTVEIVWQSWGGNEYHYYSTYLTWDSAQAYCESVGGFLVSINSYDENEFISIYLTSSAAWIGANDIDSEGTWRWIQDGSKLGYSAWYAYYSQPDDGDYWCYYSGCTSEDCAIINYHSWGEWSDMYCSYTYPFICEKGENGAPAKIVPNLVFLIFPVLFCIF
mmetsp:Transcript_6959/g.9338  ORF Transcript_6959/g.9338 Transcript_6959/m.9338 type:complete len:1729 (+) Transcript_6959:360-5546(+)